ncbi:hypothetical protein [Ruminococcus sp.]|uniref:hypothetical protein n=1 Tax=Ruminococcus sp. TaxID=41978 RepID=UPI0025F22F5E|nr:hypothetical protein [Ruminococcus sp.]
MATIAQYIAEINHQRDLLAGHLVSRGIIATANEKLNQLVYKASLLPSGTTEKTVIFDADHRDKIFLLHNGTQYGLADFTAAYPDFCSEKNDYALNYSTSIFGWDYSCYTCSTVPLTLSAATQIAMRFLANSTETGIMRLVQSDSGTAEDILTKAQTEGSYIDLSLQWLYSTDYITTLTPCENVTTGTYYLAWVGRSNNSHPLIRSITVI